MYMLRMQLTKKATFKTHFMYMQGERCLNKEMEGQVLLTLYNSNISCLSKINITRTIIMTPHATHNMLTIIGINYYF